MVTTHMEGKICLVTGANAGIGKATALGLAQQGATIVMVSRDKTKGEAARDELRAQSGNTSIDLLQADLSSQQAIRQLAETFKQRYTQLHVLINNAGGYHMQRQETPDGLEMTFAVNYLAPFLLTNLLLDTLKASAPARIINVSSAAQASNFIDLDNLQATANYSGWRAYGQSKLAEVLFTYELAHRLQGTGVTANCLHPGFVASNFGQANANPVVRPFMKLLFSNLGISTEEGAKTSLYLASSPDVEGVTGKYFVKSVPKRSAPLSYDESLQRHLWEKSELLVKLDTQPSQSESTHHM
jgi:NAD(P)-dependent dehydrogenase (short-subunit alcohol dehydrogenase family)